MITTQSDQYFRLRDGMITAKSDQCFRLRDGMPFLWRKTYHNLYGKSIWIVVEQETVSRWVGDYVVIMWCTFVMPHA